MDNRLIELQQIQEEQAAAEKALMEMPKVEPIDFGPPDDV